MTTYRSLIEGALAEIGVLAGDESAEQHSLDDGLKRLKKMLESWVIEGLLSTEQSQQQYTVATAKRAITIGPGSSTSAADITVDDTPFRIISITYDDGKARYVVDQTSQKNYNERDTDPTPETDPPAYYYYDPDDDRGTIRFNTKLPVGSVLTVRFDNYLAPDNAALDHNIHLPRGYGDAIEYNLAVRLAPSHGVKEGQLTSLTVREAKNLKTNLKLANFGTGNSSFETAVKGANIQSGLYGSYGGSGSNDGGSGGGSGGVTTFLGLSDSPSSYAGDANKFVAVRDSGDGLEFVVITPLELDADTTEKKREFRNRLGITASGSAVADYFTTLLDTPHAYASGDAGKIVAVNAGEDGVEFIENTNELTELTDTPSAYASGDAGKLLAINASEDAVEFIDPDTDFVRFRGEYDSAETYERYDAVSVEDTVTNEFSLWIYLSRSLRITGLSPPTGEGYDVSNDWYRIGGTAEYFANAIKTLSGTDRLGFTHIDGTISATQIPDDTITADMLDTGDATKQAEFRTAIGAGSGSGGEANVQSDWSETDTSDDSFILNKPTTLLLPALPASGSRDNKVPKFSGDTLGWEVSFSFRGWWGGIPSGSTVYAGDIVDDGTFYYICINTHARTSTSPASDTSNFRRFDKPNADWNQATATHPAFIQNKPTLPTSDQLLPTFPTSGSRDDKVLKFNSDTLGWEADAGSSSATVLRWINNSTRTYTVSEIKDWDQSIIFWAGPSNATWTFPDLGSADRGVMMVIRNAGSNELSISINSGSTTRVVKSHDFILLQWNGTGWIEQTEDIADVDRLLPAFPTAGSRDNKVAKFDGDTLQWEVDASGSGGEDNVQADWNETDTADDAFIRNKPTALLLPTLPTSGSRDNKVLKFNSDTLGWEADDTGGAGDITSVTAGVGLEGGGTSGDVTLNLKAFRIDTRSTRDFTPADLRGWNQNLVFWNGSSDATWTLDDMSATDDIFIIIRALSSQTLTIVGNQSTTPFSISISNHDYIILNWGTGASGWTVYKEDIADADRLLPTFPASGSRDNKVPKFNGDVLGWEVDEVGMPGSGEANVQSDWNETDTSDDAFIKNKPTIPSSFSQLTGSVADSQIPASIARDTEITAAVTSLRGGVASNRDTLKELSDAIDAISPGDDNVQSDWSETDSTDDSYIQNKPTIPAAETGGTIKTKLEALTGTNRLDATAIKDLPAAGDDNVQSDWSETDSTDDSFIQNKPTIPTSFSQLTGTVSDAQIPASIARDTEITTAINAVRQLPSYPNTGDRDDKVLKWDGNNLGWEADAVGSGGASSFAQLTGSIAAGQIPANLITAAKLATAVSSLLLPTLPSTGSRDDKVLKFNNDTLGWEADDTGSGEANVQSDWSETDSTDDSFIQNKPTIPSSFSDLSGTIDTADIGTKVVTNAKIADNAINNAKIANSSINPGQLNADDAAEKLLFRTHLGAGKVENVTGSSTAITVTLRDGSTSTINFPMGLPNLPNIGSRDNKVLKFNNDTLGWEADDTGSGEANVQSDWNETDSTDDSFIQNKPTLPTAAQLLPTLPNTGQRNNKVLKFDNDTLGWEADAVGSGGASAFADLTGNIAAGQIPANLITSAKLAAAVRSQLLPTLPTSGSRDNKLLKFNGNTLEWELDATGAASDIQFNERDDTTYTSQQAAAFDNKMVMWEGTGSNASWLLNNPTGHTAFLLWNTTASYTLTIRSSGNPNYMLNAKKLVICDYDGTRWNFTNIDSRFDLDADVTSETTALAFDDKFLIADESESGDPNRYILASNARKYLKGYRGEWGNLTQNTDRLYVGDLVQHAGEWYIVKVEHLRGGSGPDGDSTNFAPLDNYRGNWVSGSYQTGIIVRHSSKTWMSVQDVSGSDPAPGASRNTKWIDLTGGEDNVQSDWNETTTTSDAFIKNKPTLPTATQLLPAFPTAGSRDDKVLKFNNDTLGWEADAVGTAGSGEANVQSDWNETDTSDDAFIKNKPTIPTALSQLSGTVTDSQIPAGITRDTELSGSITQLKGAGLPANRDTMKELSDAIDAISPGEDNVQSDWSETDSSDDSFIQNKPTIPTSFSQLSGTVSDAQIPASIARDTEITTAINAVRQLPSYPNTGDRDNKVLKFNNDVLGWEADAVGASGATSFSGLTGQIALNQIPNNILTAAKIAENAIGNSELQDDAVNPENLNADTSAEKRALFNAINANHVYVLSNANATMSADDVATLNGKIVVVDSRGISNRSLTFTNQNMLTNTSVSFIVLNAGNVPVSLRGRNGGVTSSQTIGGDAYLIGHLAVNTFKVNRPLGGASGNNGITATVNASNDAEIGITDGGVVTAKLARQAVTSDKLADDAVNPVHINADTDNEKKAFREKIGASDGTHEVIVETLSANKIFNLQDKWDEWKNKNVAFQGNGSDLVVTIQPNEDGNWFPGRVEYSQSVSVASQFVYNGSTSWTIEPSNNNRYAITDSNLIPSGSPTRLLGRLRLWRTGRVTLYIADSQTEALPIAVNLDPQTSHDLSDAFEEDGEIVITQGSNTITIPTTGSDETEPYNFNNLTAAKQTEIQNWVDRNDGSAATVKFVAYDNASSGNTNDGESINFHPLWENGRIELINFHFARHQSDGSIKEFTKSSDRVNATQGLGEPFKLVFADPYYVGATLIKWHIAPLTQDVAGVISRYNQTVVHVNELNHLARKVDHLVSDEELSYAMPYWATVDVSSTTNRVAWDYDLKTYASTVRIIGTKGEQTLKVETTFGSDKQYDDLYSVFKDLGITDRTDLHKNEVALYLQPTYASGSVSGAKLTVICDSRTGRMLTPLPVDVDETLTATSTDSRGRKTFANIYQMYAYTATGIVNTNRLSQSTTNALAANRIRVFGDSTDIATARALFNGEMGTGGRARLQWFDTDGNRQNQHVTAFGATTIASAGSINSLLNYADLTITAGATDSIPEFVQSLHFRLEALEPASWAVEGNTDLIPSNKIAAGGSGSGNPKGTLIATSQSFRIIDNSPSRTKGLDQVPDNRITTSPVGGTAIVGLPTYTLSSNDLTSYYGTGGGLEFPSTPRVDNIIGYYIEVYRSVTGGDDVLCSMGTLPFQPASDHEDNYLCLRFVDSNGNKGNMDMSYLCKAGSAETLSYSPETWFITFPQGRIYTDWVLASGSNRIETAFADNEFFYLKVYEWVDSASTGSGSEATSSGEGSAGAFNIRRTEEATAELSGNFVLLGGSNGYTVDENATHLEIEVTTPANFTPTTSSPVWQYQDPDDDEWRDLYEIDEATTTSSVVDFSASATVTHRFSSAFFHTDTSGTNRVKTRIKAASGATLDGDDLDLELTHEEDVDSASIKPLKMMNSQVVVSSQNVGLNLVGATMSEVEFDVPVEFDNLISITILMTTSDSHAHEKAKKRLIINKDEIDEVGLWTDSDTLHLSSGIKGWYSEGWASQGNVSSLNSWDASPAASNVYHYASNSGTPTRIIALQKTGAYLTGLYVASFKQPTTIKNVSCMRKI